MNDDDVESVLRAERARPGFSPDQRRAMWKGIEASIAPAGAATSPATATDRPGASPDARSAAGTVGRGKIGALVAMAAIGGAGLGAAAHTRFAEPRIVTVAAPPLATVTAAPARTTAELNDAPPPTAAATTSSVALPASVPAVPPAVTARVVPNVRLAPTTSQKEPARDLGLARERVLLDMARTALARGDTASALSAVDSHAREFPSSQLAEEREVIAIQALAATNRTDAAKQRADTFRKNHPNSVLLPIVEEATK